MTDPKPSKTALKQAQSELQALGERLIDLEASDIDALGLDERLLEAVETARRIRSREALRRQKQYIGKLMRTIDAEPVKQFFANREQDAAREKRLFSNAERWRDRIVREGRSAVDAFFEEYGNNDGTLVGLLNDLDSAFSDKSEKTAKRAIFRYVHAALVAKNKDG